MQPKGDEHVNAPNMDVAQKGNVNEQHQNVAKLVMQSDVRAFSTTHQKTPWTTTQPQVVNVYHDDNHEPIQPFDEVVFAQ